MDGRCLYKAKRMDNREWMEGYLIKVNKNFFICEHPYQCMSEYSSVDGQFYGFGGFKMINLSTICQYTGLIDKNSKKIWENDFIRDEEGNIGIVKFGQYNNYHIGFFVEWIEKEMECYRTDLGYWALKGEVAGNIFDNPGLLEGGIE